MATEPVRMSASIAEISKALIAFHRACPKIPKLSRNPFLKSKYADLSTILEIVQPILNDCDLVVQQHPTANFGLTTIVSHASGEWISSEYPMQPLEAIVEKATGDRPASKAITPQSIGTVITYQRRYAIGAILALNIDDDNDGSPPAETTAAVPAGPKKTAHELMAEAAAKVNGQTSGSNGQPGAVAGVTQRVETVSGNTPAGAESPPLAGESTVEQRDKLKQLFDVLNIDAAGQLGILKKRGLATIRSLSYEQAAEIIGKLEAMAGVPTQADADQFTAGGSTADRGVSTASVDGPCTVEQIAAIKLALTEWEQSQPGVTADFIARLNGAGFGKIADMNFDQARELLSAIEATNIRDFFGSVLSTAAAG